MNQRIKRNKRKVTKKNEPEKNEKENNKLGVDDGGKKKPQRQNNAKHRKIGAEKTRSLMRI